MALHGFVHGLFFPISKPYTYPYTRKLTNAPPPRASAQLIQVEIKRWQDFWNPNSVNKDPLFPNNKIADHEPGYPGLALFVVSGDGSSLQESTEVLLPKAICFLFIVLICSPTFCCSPDPWPR